MIKINRTQLKNGLKIVHYHMPWVNTVSIGYFVRAGSVDELKPNEYGISHFLEHMVFNGTKNYPSREASVLEGEFRGIYQNAWTFCNATSYWMASTKDEFEKSFDIVTDRVFNPKLKGLAKEKGIIIEEVKMGEDDPDRKIWLEYMSLAYKDSDLEHDVIGTIESVSGFSKEDLFNYHNKFYNPANIVLAVSGNIEFEKAVEFANSYTSKIKKGEKNERKQIKKNNYKGRQVVFTKKDFMSQTKVLMGFKAGSLKSDDRYSQAILNAILGQGKTSILNRELKVDKSLVSGVSSALELLEDCGYLGIEYSFDNAKAGELKTALNGILLKLKNGDIDKKDFERAKNMIVGSYEFAYESSLPFIDFQGFAHEEMLLDKEINPEDELEKLKSVTLDDVKKSASEIIDQDNFVASVVGKDEGVVKSI